MERLVTIATRGSTLALVQFEMVAERLRQMGIRCEKIIVKSQGELDIETPLYQQKEQGIFVRKLNDKIEEGVADAAIHSAKDIPSEISPRLTISYFSERGDPRDYFVARGNLSNFDGTVGTSSIRRKMFLSLYNRNLAFQNLRGNIETRLRKWERGQVDSLVVAKVALDRLGKTPPGEVIPEEICPPDPNQGFIAVVTSRGNWIETLFNGIQEDGPLWEASSEREVMRELNIGCNVAASIRANFSDRTIRFSYANEEKRYDFSFRGTLDGADLVKLRLLIDE